MSVKLKVKRGLSADLPARDDGSLIFTTDTKKMYLDSATDRIEIGENKLDKITSTDTSSATARVYSITNAGDQSTLKVTTNPTPNYLAQYRTGGILRSNTPSANLDVANKKYVDDAVAGAGGGSSLRTATYIIASSDSLDDAKNAADLVIQTTEDTAAKLAAITLTADGPNPGTYYFAPGTYNITSNTTVNCPGTYSFIGYGAKFYVKAAAFTFGDSTSSVDSCLYFEGIEFTQVTQLPGTGIYVSTHIGVVIVNKCSFTGNLPVGISLESVCGLRATNCIFNNVAVGIQSSRSSPIGYTDSYCDLIVDHCTFNDYGNAIECSGSYPGKFIIVNNTFIAKTSTDYAIYFDSAATQITTLIISNNISYTGKFMWSTASTARNWSDITISNNISSPNAAAYDICLYGVFTNTVISDNNCKYGIKLWTSGSTSTNLTVKGNVVSALSMHAGLDDYTTGSFSKVVITGNLVTGQYYSNIGGSRWALNKGSIIDGNSIYRYHSSDGSYDDQFYVSGNSSAEWASTSQVMFGNNIDNA